MAARFHNGVARLVVDVCGRLRDLTGLNSVALSGGVFQNRLLLAMALPRLVMTCLPMIARRMLGA